jgi:hypothetical protein
MTKAQVERVLGREHFVNARGGTYTEFAWDFASWTVGFQRGRTVQMSTSLASQRTKKGIGPGKTWLAVMRAYPGGRCTWNVRLDAGGHPTAYWAEYLVGHRSGSQTLYVFGHGVARVGETGPPTISQVVVRSTFQPLPEFASNWIYRCGGDWRRAEGPELRFVNP